MAEQSVYVVRAWIQEDNRWLSSSSPVGPWKGPFLVGELSGVEPSEAEEVRQVLLRRANQLDGRRYRIQLSIATGAGLRVARGEIVAMSDPRWLAGLVRLCAEIQAQILDDMNELVPPKHEVVQISSREDAGRVGEDSDLGSTGGGGLLDSQATPDVGLETIDSGPDPDRQRKQRQLDLWNVNGMAWQEIAALILRETGIDNSPGAMRMETTRFAAKTGQPIRTGKPGAKKRTIAHEKNV